jgi:TatD DNase family protein
MEFIDSHAHLYLPEFDNDRDFIIKQAISKGITKMVLPNIDASTLEPMAQLCNTFAQHCFPAIGLHPTSIRPDYKIQLDKIFNHHPIIPAIAIGEIGIDLYWDKTYFKEQAEAFEYQLKLAKELHLPVIIHCRESFDAIIAILKKDTPNLPFGVFHSFTGNTEQAKIIVDLGFKIGINGVVTYKNSRMDEMIRQMPLTEIILETDAPYLTPVPFRGKRNDSAYLIYIAQKIADIKMVTIDMVASVTTQNTMNLFTI